MPAQYKSSHIPSNPDVLIIGAGSAGMAAAVGSGKTGASVLVVEKNEYGGGKATASFVGTICGLYFTAPDKNSQFVMGGFPKEFALQLMNLNNTHPVFQKGGLHFLPYDRSAFINLCATVLQKHAHTVCMQHSIEAVSTEKNKISSVTITDGNQSTEIFPKAVVDASGDALFAKLIGLEYIRSDQYQAAAHVFVISGIEQVEFTVLNLSILRTILSAIELKLLPEDYSRISIIPGTFNNGTALFKIGIPLVITDAPDCYANAEQFALKAIHELFEYLKINISFFSNSFISLIAPETGIRTGPRNLGKYILTEEDVLSCRKFPDSIARGSWPVEFWEPGKNVELTYFADNDFYDIPVGVIQSDKVENLFFAGRNISATDKAVASARVIGTCLQTGYAAGVLAGDYAAGTAQGQSILTIQKELFSNESK